jgi:hypothetical protein
VLAAGLALILLLRSLLDYRESRAQPSRRNYTWLILDLVQGALSAIWTMSRVGHLLPSSRYSSALLAFLRFSSRSITPQAKSSNGKLRSLPARTGVGTPHLLGLALLGAVLSSSKGPVGQCVATQVLMTFRMRSLLRKHYSRCHSLA